MNKDLIIFSIGWTVILTVCVFFLVRDIDSKRVRDPVELAHCIAEETYTNPHPDKFQELVNAIATCQERG
jgi:hypothetical protein